MENEYSMYNLYITYRLVKYGAQKKISWRVQLQVCKAYITMVANQIKGRESAELVINPTQIFENNTSACQT